MEKNTRLLFWFIAALFLLALIYWLRPILTPFVFSALMAYLGDPAVDRLERLKLSRSMAVTVVFSIMTLSVVLIFLLLLPLVAAQIDLFRQVLPGYIEWFRQASIPWLQTTFGIEWGSELIEQLQLALQQNWSRASDIMTLLLSRVTQSSLAIIGWLGSLALIPVVTFYLLRDWDLLMAHIRDLLPRANVESINRLATECDEVLGAFLRGQLLIMACLAAIYTTGLIIIGLDLALLIGMLAGIASIVPYLGAAIGIISAAIAAMVQFQDYIYLLPVAVVFGVGQMIESLFLTPVLVGDKIGLHPVAVIFAVLAGGQLFGFVGVLLALPVAAVLMVLLRHAHHSYKSSVFYHQ